MLVAWDAIDRSLAVNSAGEAPKPSYWSSNAAVWVAAGFIVAAVTLAYWGSFRGPFVFDDLASIVANPTLQHFSSAWAPPVRGITVSGRPLLNLSFALNYAVSGLGVWSYHALNLLIHLSAALTLFGIVRRTLVGIGRHASQPPSAAEANPTAFALAASLLWALHPLQTESVTYIVQRAESLMGLFYLLTLYCFVRYADFTSSGGSSSGSLQGFRGVEARRRRVAGVERDLRQRNAQSVPLRKHSIRWDWLSVIFCLLGMATKEVMVTAPVVVLLYDRTFIGGSFRAAWTRPRAYYLALTGTWAVLAVLLVLGAGRGGAGGFAGVPWWDYGLTQFRAVAHYLRLSVWPRPLVFDYGAMLEAHPAAVLPQAVLVVALAAGSVVLCVRGQAIGFLGAWFFVILLPSSSIVPVPTETIAEHRMYLSLAAVVVAVVAGAGWVLDRLRLRAGGGLLGGAILLAAAAALGVGTARRNADYRSGRALWSDTVNHWPVNARAHSNLGMELVQDGDLAGAEAQFRLALALEPRLATAGNNLGQLLPSVYFNRGMQLHREGQLEAAAAEYREALRLNPNEGEVWYNLGNNLVQRGQTLEAASAYANAVRLRPDFADAHVNYGSVLMQLNRTAEAIREFREALRIQPGATDVRQVLQRLEAQQVRP